MTGGFSFGSGKTGGTSGFSFGNTPAPSTTQATTAPANASFTFGAASAQQAPKLGGFGQQPAANASFTFGAQPAQTTTAAPTTGLFGQAAAPAQTTQPFGAGQQPQQPTANPPAYNFGAAPSTQQPNVTTSQAAGFGLGLTPQSSGSTGFQLGGLGQTAATSTPAATGFQQLAKPATTISTGFNLTQTTKPAGVTFATPVATSSGGLMLGGTPAKPSTTSGAGLSFNLSGTSTAAGALTLGAPATTPGKGLTLGATSTPSTGFTLGAVNPTSTTGGLTLGGLGGTTATATVKPTLTLGAAAPAQSFLGGGLGGLAASTASTTATGIFASSAPTATTVATGIFAAATTTISSGLGGVDPKTTSSGTSASGSVGKPGDTKAVKETNILNEMQVTVEDFKKYVKNQKTVRENIARMSSTPLFKVQEEVANLKQLLSLVSNGLQRNSVTIDKLKHESAQELKHAEIAQRTKETPPGLQYEHTAPIEYFQRLVDGFESQMIFYRQQIEEMENHLNSLNMGITLTPQEMSQILSKLHETFIGLAGHLQMIHEAVKVQKDHFLAHRRRFHGDNTDIFEKRRKAKQATGSSVVVTVGPTPFTGLSNAAAVAMATAMNRNEAPTGLGMNPTGFGTGQVTGLGAGTGTGGLLAGSSGTGFGASTGFGINPATTQSTGFGTGLNMTNTATVRPLGSTTTGLFGASTSQQSVGFGQNQSTTSAGFGSGSQSAGAGFGFGNTSTFGTPNTNEQSSFQLQNPPLGTKRGKKA